MDPATAPATIGELLRQYGPWIVPTLLALAGCWVLWKELKASRAETAQERATKDALMREMLVNAAAQDKTLQMILRVLEGR